METKVLLVHRESHDTVRLRLPATFKYAPGQFLMVGSQLQGKEVKRSYSIASMWNGEFAEIIVKRQDPGLFSQYAQELEGGETINVYGPYGHHFIFDPVTTDPSDHIVFMAGGSGIAPFRAMLQAAAASNYAGKITLLYSVRTSEDVVFDEEIQQLASRINLDYFVTVTRPSEQEMTSWKGKFGRITGKLVHDALGQDLSRMRFYICGPTAMVQDTQILLERLSVAKDKVKTEKFGSIT
jgi:ferredoxin-NADP reductase